jgi:long-chain acyl-CoA synthetase
MMKTLTPTEKQLLFGEGIENKKHPAIIQAGESIDRISSYGEFYDLTASIESMFLAKGLSFGDRIVLLSPNTIELAASVIAAWRAGLLAIPVDFRMTAQEAANVADKVEAALIMVSSQFADVRRLYDLVKESFPGLTEKLVTLEESVIEAGGTSLGASSSPANQDFTALAILTSGTTGVPKGAVHDFKSLIANLLELGELGGLNEEVVALLPLPVSHIFGLEVLAACLMHGSTIVFCDLEPGKLLKSIEKYRPHILAGVPLMYGALLSAKKQQIPVNLDRARILLCGGAPLPVSLSEEFESQFGKRINNGYGSTESKIIALNLDGPAASIGRPVPSVTVKIVNEEGGILPEGQEGEIIIDSPNLMKGYLGQPEKTREVLSNLGYRTGDIGYVKDGYVFISGRAKEMIVVAGNKVFPIEVEEVLLKNPLVLEVAITGPEHRRLGQIVKATVVIRDDELSQRLSGTLDEQKAAREEILKSLKEFCQGNLKRELRPMEWEVRPSSQPLPKTRSGKIDKKALV